MRVTTTIKLQCAADEAEVEMEVEATVRVTEFRAGCASSLHDPGESAEVQWQAHLVHAVTSAGVVVLPPGSPIELDPVDRERIEDALLREAG